MFDSFHLDILVGIGVPATGAMIFIVRHFWIKTKCFALMQQRLEELERDNEDAKRVHRNTYERLDAMSRDIHYIRGFLDRNGKRPK